MKKVKFPVFIIVFAMVAPAWADNDKAADMELLEYLGSFETSNGKPVDPLLFKQDSKSGKMKEGSANRGKESRKQQKDKSELKERDYEK